MLSTLSDEEGTSKPVWLWDGRGGLFKDADVRSEFRERGGVGLAQTEGDWRDVPGKCMDDPGRAPAPRGKQLQGAGVGLLRAFARGLLGRCGTGSVSGFLGETWCQG